MEAQETRSRGSDLAFVLVVAVSLMMLVIARVLNDRPAMLVIVVLVSLAYLGIGTYGHRRMERMHSPLMTALYYIVQLILGGFVTIVGESSPWLLLLPLISQAVQGLSGLWSVLLIAAALLTEITPIILVGRWDAVFTGGASFLAAVVFVAVFTRLMVSEQQARQALAEANRKLRDYTVQVEELATTQERNRLAREIHDGLGHYLTSINIQIKAAQAIIKQDPGQAETALENAQTLAQEALADVRRSISSLRADPSTNKPLAETLVALVQEARGSGLSVDLKISGKPLPLSPQVEFTLYRVAQEGLTNVRKHSQATHAEIFLNYDDCCSGTIALSVKDNGVGSQDASGGFGLTGLQERVQLMGGKLNVKTSPGSGFALLVEIPV